MTTVDTINYLTIAALCLLIVALIYFLYILVRAHKILYKVEHLQETFGSYVKEILPAILNVGTLAATTQQIVHYIEKIYHHTSKTGGKDGDKK